MEPFPSENGFQTSASREHYYCLFVQDLPCASCFTSREEPSRGFKKFANWIDCLSTKGEEREWKTAVLLRQRVSLDPIRVLTFAVLVKDLIHWMYTTPTQAKEFSSSSKFTHLKENQVCLVSSNYWRETGTCKGWSILSWRRAGRVSSGSFSGLLSPLA